MFSETDSWFWYSTVSSFGSVDQPAKSYPFLTKEMFLRLVEELAEILCMSLVPAPKFELKVIVTLTSYVPVTRLGVTGNGSEVEVLTAVKEMVCAPAWFTIRRLSKVAVPDSVTREMVPETAPGPEALVAVIVYALAKALLVISLLENLSCTVTTGGGLNAVFINASTGVDVGT